MFFNLLLRRASCMYMWNTTDGGPCVLRPIKPDCFDAPNRDKNIDTGCVEGVDSDLKCIIGKTGNEWKTQQCNDPESKYYTFCDENNIVHSNYTLDPATIVEGPWADVEPDEDVSAMKN